MANESQTPNSDSGQTVSRHPWRSCAFWVGLVVLVAALAALALAGVWWMQNGNRHGEVNVEAVPATVMPTATIDPITAAINAQSTRMAEELNELNDSIEDLEATLAAPMPTSIPPTTIEPTIKAEVQAEANDATHFTRSGNAPAPWIPDNEENGAPICDWGIPSGTVLMRNGEVTKLTNCVSFNLRHNGTQNVSWTYSQEDYDFLLEDWDGSDATMWEGAAWWSQVQDKERSYAEVRYNGGPMQQCTSFEILPGVLIEVVFKNMQGTPTIWSQGSIVTYEPECTYNTQAASPAPTATLTSTKTPSQPQPTTVAPTPSHTMPEPGTVYADTLEVVFGPFTFKSGAPFDATYQGIEGNTYVFRLEGFAIETITDGNCDWYNWSDGQPAGQPDWTDDNKVICTAPLVNN